MCIRACRAFFASPSMSIQHYCLFPTVEGDDNSAPTHFLTTGDEYARLVVDTITDGTIGKAAPSSGKRDLSRYDFTG